MSNLLKYERFIIYLVLFFLVIKLLRNDTKETFNNPNPDYDPIAIANLSNFVGKYHDKIENLSNLLDQQESLKFPNIEATDKLTTKNIEATDKLTTKNIEASDDITTTKNLKGKQLCLDGVCIGKIHLEALTGTRHIHLSSEVGNNYGKCVDAGGDHGRFFDLWNCIGGEKNQRLKIKYI